MASSSSSSSSVPTRKWTHDVFLSFRGEDTRHNFVDHLYKALDERDIQAFKDDKTLDKGKSISRELLKAIEESRCAVIVFSKNYADSSWCLDELVKIMDCQNQMGQTVLPVFYHVDPTHVRGQKRDFDTAFQKHEDKFKGEMEKVNKWRKALAAAAGITGWHVPGNGGESDIVTAVAEKILEKILEDKQPRDMEKNLIGIGPRIDRLKSLLDMKATEEVRMVGVFGMGGIGKTTIAKALFRQIARNFDVKSFVKDVSKKCSSDEGIYALQGKILNQIRMKRDMHGFEDPEQGANMIQERFSDKKVLLVLDDVDDVKQLEFLAATHEWFGRGSRIIITTRDENLLSDADAKYKPDFLHPSEAVELFCRHAFREKSPPEGYEELSYRAIRYASGLPLAVEVLGSFFHGRELGVWESALNRLDKASNDKIVDILKLSFDGLDVFDKKIFLDIACFFKGKDVEHVTRVLDSFGFEPVLGISVLTEKSLITVSNKKIDMHDLIQQMGCQIVRESYPNSRLWQLKQIHDLIKGKKNPKEIEAIIMENENHVHDHGAKLGLGADVIASMENLRVLDVYGNFTSSQPTFLPDELRWLCWNWYPFLFLPLADMCKLVGLEMDNGYNGYIEHLWKGRKILPNLKYIHLERVCIISFPDVSGAPNIERLTLSYCWKLKEVHESLGSHRGIVHLNMNGCSQLKRLPWRIEMESLETLILSGCYNLERFPEVSKCMGKLSEINLFSCSGLKKLPSSIGDLCSLRVLNLANCVNLKKIPGSVCELKHLKCLHLHNCMQLKNLPKKLGSMNTLEELWLRLPSDIKKPPKFVGFHSLTGLSCLKKLDLSWREIEEESFPKNLDALSSLEELYLSGNPKLVHLPASVFHLSCLKRLELNNCSQLESLCTVPSSLQVLKANDCISLKKIGDLSKQCKWLYKIWLVGSQKLLEDEENERYLDNLLQLSFVKVIDLILLHGHTF